jgi:hypothetical protein
MAPNDQEPPDPDTYAGSVHQQLPQDAVTQLRAQHREDRGYYHDPERLSIEHEAEDAARAQAEQFSAAQHDRLAYEVTTRGGPPIDAMNYPGISHEELYAMVNNDIDPGGVDAAGAAWNAVGTTLHGISDRLTGASASTEEAWTGSAAGAARAFTTGIAAWSASTGRGAVLSSNNLATQSEGASAAKSAVPPPVHYDMWGALQDLMTSPDPAAVAATIRQNLLYQQELHQQAVDAVTRYDYTLTQSVTSMPAFAPPPTFTPPSDSTRPQQPGRVAPSLDGHHVLPGPGSPPLRNGSQSPVRTSDGTTSHIAGGTTPVPARPEGQAVSSGTHISTTDPALIREERTPEGLDNPIDEAQTAGHRNTGRDASSGPVTAGPVGGISSRPGEPGAARGLGGEPDVGGGRGRPGGGFAGGPGGGVDSRGPGAGVGGVAAEEAATKTGLNTRGNATRAGLGGMPTTGAPTRTPQDDEHERPSYLVEHDPNTLFGTDEATAPPVIE